MLVNGLGGTPKEELYILFRRVSQLLGERGVTAKHVWVGEFATAMEMAGASISILHLDEELDPPCRRSGQHAFLSALRSVRE